jgi:hypothetical protein
MSQTDDSRPGAAQSASPPNRRDQRRPRRPLFLPLAALVVVSALVPAQLWATTTVPPPFDWVNGLITYIRAAAIPFTVLMLMICAIAWVPAKNGEGIVAFGGRALIALTVILWGGLFITIIGFQGAVV